MVANPRLPQPFGKTNNFVNKGPNPGVRSSFLGRNLSGYQNAVLNGVHFRLNPTKISLDYRVKASETPTIGGMVVQVFGVELGDLNIIGTFGAGGWQEQAKFLEDMMNLANYQASPLAYAKAPHGPVRFFYPQRNYDFMVYLKSYGSASGMAIDFQNENFAPDWHLTLMIDADNTGGNLVRAASNAYIARLKAGLGYKETGYMGNVFESSTKPINAGQVNQQFGLPGEQTLSSQGDSTPPTSASSAQGHAGTVSDPGSIANYQDWSVALLKALGAPQTAANITSLNNWYGKEGGNWGNTAKYNPFNCGLQLPGSVNYATGAPGSGVQAYTSWQQGLQAYVDIFTTTPPQTTNWYGPILKALMAGVGLNTGDPAVQNSLSIWSDKGYTSV